MYKFLKDFLINTVLATFGVFVVYITIYLFSISQAVYTWSENQILDFWNALSTLHQLALGTILISITLGLLFTLIDLKNIRGGGCFG